MTAPLLGVNRLGVTIKGPQGTVPILADISFEVDAGQTIGLVGESGSGKSMTARAIMGLLPKRAAITGQVTFAGEPVFAMERRRLRNYRANDVAMIFQDARAHVNPVHRIGDFLTEGLTVNQGVDRKSARHRAVKLLDEVGIDQPDQRFDQYPHEVSGGMLQRVMIAAALAADPKLILADEPTTALDVSTQSEVMAILADLQDRRQLAIVFITHDLDLASAVCDQIAVLYAGSMMEIAASKSLTDNPQHPYSSALIECRPSIDRRHDRLATVAGTPVALSHAPPGCVFAPRCPHRSEICDAERPALGRTGRTGHAIACHLAETLDGGPSGLTGSPT